MGTCSFDVMQFVHRIKALGQKMEDEGLKTLAEDEAERLFREQFAHMNFDEVKAKNLKKMLEKKILLATVRYILKEE